MRRIVQVSLVIALVLAGCNKSKPVGGSAIKIEVNDKPAKDGDKRANYEKHISQGKNMLESGKRKEAGDHFREALKLYPDDEQAESLLAKVDAKVKERRENYQLAMSAGQSALKDKKYKEAINSFKSALSTRPGDKAATDALDSAQRLHQAKLARLAAQLDYERHMEDAQAAMTSKKYAEALKAFEAALVAKPGDIAGNKGKSAVLALLKPPVDPTKKKIEEDYQLAMSAGQSALKDKKYQRAVNSFKEALRLKPEDKAAATALVSSQNLLKAEDTRLVRETAYAKHMKDAQAAMTSKKYAEALKAFEAALVAKPGDIAGNKGKSAVLALLKPPVDPTKKKIEEDYQLAMSAGQSALKDKKYQGAVNSFKEALRLKPEDKTAATALVSSQNLLKAEETRRANEVAYAKHMKDAQAAMTSKKYVEAITAFDEALKIKPNDPAATKGKKAAEALKAVKPKVDPKAKQREEDYQLAMSAGRAALKTNNFVGAINSFKEALRLKPGDMAATAALESCQKLQKAEEGKKREAAYAGFMKKGQDLLKSKKYVEAVTAFDEALKIKPGDPAAIKGKKEADEARKKK